MLLSGSYTDTFRLLRKSLPTVIEDLSVFISIISMVVL
jgi:hypothetical protein